METLHTNIDPAEEQMQLPPLHEVLRDSLRRHRNEMPGMSEQELPEHEDENLYTQALNELP